MMNQEKIIEIKKSIIAIGRLLWDKELVTGLNGNISSRIEGDTIAITGTQTCLGLLAEKDILPMTLDGNVLEEGRVSTERLLHTEIYKAFPDVAAVIHTHVSYTNAYFLENDVLEPRIFESKVYLGSITAVPQETPAVTDVGPVVAALKKSNIAVLKNHGVVAVGKNLFDCFLLIQCLEDAAKIEAISKLFRDQRPETRDCDCAS
jgi:L-fuculose-phosphate aldolase